MPCTIYKIMQIERKTTSSLLCDGNDDDEFLIVSDEILEVTAMMSVIKAIESWQITCMVICIHFQLVEKMDEQL